MSSSRRGGRGSNLRAYAKPQPLTHSTSPSAARAGRDRSRDRTRDRSRDRGSTSSGLSRFPAPVRERGNGSAAGGSMSARRRSYSRGGRGGGEEDYVSTLEGELHALELQNKLLKEKSVGHGMGATAGFGSEQGADALVLALQVKYQQMETRFKGMIEELQRDFEGTKLERDRAIKESVQLQDTLENLRSKLHQVQVSAQQQNQQWMSYRVRVEQTVQRLHSELEERKTQAEALRADLHEEKIAHEIEIEELRMSYGEKLHHVEEWEHKAKQLEAEVRTLNVKLIEADDDGVSEAVAAEQDRKIAEARKEAARHATNAKKVQYELDRLRAQIEQMERDHQTLSDELQLSIGRQEDLKTKLAAADRRWSDNEARGNRYSATLVDLRAENAKLKQGTQWYDDRIKRQETVIRELREKLASAIVGREEDARAVRHAEAAQERLADRERELMDIKVQLEHDVMLLGQEHKELKRDYDVLERELQRTRDELVEMSVAKEHAESQLATMKSVEQLELGKFQSLMDSNKKVAESIQGLLAGVSRMQNTPPASSTSTRERTPRAHALGSSLNASLGLGRRPVPSPKATLDDVLARSGHLHDVLSSDLRGVDPPAGRGTSDAFSFSSPPRDIPAPRRYDERERSRASREREELPPRRASREREDARRVSRAREEPLRDRRAREEPAHDDAPARRVERGREEPLRDRRAREEPAHDDAPARRVERGREEPLRDRREEPAPTGRDRNRPPARPARTHVDVDVPSGRPEERTPGRGRGYKPGDEDEMTPPGDEPDDEEVVTEPDDDEDDDGDESDDSAFSI